MADRPTVGVLGLQGGVAEHVDLLEQLGARAVRLRRPEHLLGPDGLRVDALVLPGGESSTITQLARAIGVLEPLREAIHSGVPTLGTCAGLILLAARVIDAAAEDAPGSAPGRARTAPPPGASAALGAPGALQALDVTVRRNAWGSQHVSVEADFAVRGIPGNGADGGVRGALIRAPEIVSHGAGARVIATRDGRIVGVTSVEPEREADPAHGLGAVTGIAFHPELSGDAALHAALLARAQRH